MGTSGPERGDDDYHGRDFSERASGDSDRNFLNQIKHDQDLRDAVAPKVIIDRRKRGIGYMFFLAITTLASVLAIIVVSHVYIRFLFPIPLPYTYDYVTPDPVPEVCPGDTIVYQPTIHITRAPVVIHLYRSIYSQERGQTVVFASEGIRVIHDTPHTITRTYEFIPPNLPPGAYSVKESAQDNSTRASVISVPFVIKAGCTDRPDLPLVPQSPRIRPLVP